MSAEKNRAFAIEVVQRLREAGYESLWAGGCVRDQLLGLTPKDYDVATDAEPHTVRRLFGKRRTLAIGESFGVIVVLPHDKSVEQIEVATFRNDGQYSDGRRPDSVQFSTAKEDAERRDYTINGMFFDPVKNEVIDYVGGEKDLQQRVIRSIGDAEERIAEDKLRMLRAIRFTARFQFQLDKKTFDAIQTMAPQIRQVSRERICQELQRMFAHPARTEALQLLSDTGLLLEVLPELKPDWNQKNFAERTGLLWERLKDSSYEVALAILLRNLSAEAKDVLRGLKMSNQDVECISWLVNHQASLVQADQLPLHQLKRLLVHDHIEKLLDWMQAAELVDGTENSQVEFCRSYLATHSSQEIDPAPLITGGDLIVAGIKPGPEFAVLLERVRDAQLNEEISTKAEAMQLIDPRA